MSRDVQLAFNCPHLIGEERVTLGTDRRTLYTSKPISGQSLIKVVCNDLYPVSPFTGMVNRATVTSYRREPFKVTLASRALVIRSQVGTVATTLPTGYLSAAQVVAFLTSVAGAYVTTTTSTTGYITITDAGNPGLASRVQLSGSSPEALGFELQSGDKGKVVVPPWRLYSRNAVNPEDAVDSLGHYIGFDSPVSQGMYFSVTYPVAPNLCLRCLTTEVENDYRFDAQGNPLMVQDENLLYQSCLKVLLTELRSNVYYPWYGSTLNSMIGSKVVGGTVSGLRQSVSNALTMFQNLQTAQAKYQRITAKERLFSVDYIDVAPSPDDPTVFLIEVGVRNYSNEAVSITIVYTAPGTFALPGTNQLSMGNY
jgi:phage baseplate assembly protein W